MVASNLAALSLGGAVAVAAPVEIAPGTDIQSVVDANPAGAEFLLLAGVHRGQQITPKDSQVFRGEPGAVLNGSKVLAGWIRDGSHWYVTGQTQQGLVQGLCDPGFERCNRPEELFIDGVTLRHVTSLGAVGPGSWYFDYGADRIYVGEDPAGRLVETSVTPAAFSGSADGVVIRDLVVEKYANPAQEGAIDSRGGGDGLNWVIDGVEARLNHGSGIHIAGGGVIRNSFVHHNGQQGFSANGTGIVVEDTEISFNNTARFSLDWEGGGNKLIGTDLIVRRNWSHDNYGPGIWIDINSFNVVIEDNVVERNFRAGIFFEVSNQASIRGNYSEGNGLDDQRAADWLWSPGILVASSLNAEVYDNVVVNNGNGITATQQDRGSGPWGLRRVENLNVHDNWVTMVPDTIPPNTQSKTGAVQDVGDNAIFTSRNNTFQNNTYYGSGTRFAWFNGSHTFAGWQSYGLDATGSISAIATTPPTWSSSLTATGSTLTTITLEWSGASDPDGIGAYRVYEDTLGLVAATAGATTATVRFLQPATTYNFTVEAVDVQGTDSTTGPNTAAGTSGSNGPPTANPDTAVTQDATTVTIDVVANDTDPDGNLEPASVVAVSGPSDGSLVNNGDGTFDYTPDGGFIGEDGFIYEVCDSEPLCDTALVSISVTLPNDLPVANDDFSVTSEDTAVLVDVVANDSDPDGNLDPSTAVAVSVPNNGSLVNNGDGTFTYAPDLDFNGSDGFTYEVCDTLGLCDTAVVSIDVTSVNDPPVAVADAAETTVDTLVTIDVVANDTDVDGNLDAASVVAVSGPSNGSLVNNGDGSFTYTPNSGFIGDDGFTYEVCDIGSLCDTGLVSITVTAGVPVIFSAEITAGSDDAEERVGGGVSLASSDLELVFDGSNQTVGLRWVGVDVPQGVTITAAWVQFQVDEATSVATSLTIDGQAADSAATFTSAAFGISSRPRTGASVAWAPAAWTVIGARGADQRTPDLSPVIQEIIDRPGWAAGNAVALIITGTGERVAESRDGNAIAAAELHIEYLDVPVPNRPPVANDDAAGTVVDTSVTVDVVANDTDPDGNLDPSSASLVAGPSNGGLANNGDGSFTYTPNGGFTGGDGFTYEVCDTEPLCDTALVSITVTAAAPQTFVAAITAGSDDAEELVDGHVSVGSSDIEMVFDRGGNQTVGLRWTGVNIPPGALITDAWVQFQVDEATSVATTLTIQGQASDDAATFTSAVFDVSARPRTPAAVEWLPVPWTTVGARGAEQRTPDLATIVQEIVNRPGWAAGNALALIVSGSGERVAESYDGSDIAAPEIHITYTVP